MFKVQYQCGSKISVRGRQPLRRRLPAIWSFFTETCMKMKKFWLGARLLDPQLSTYIMSNSTVVTFREFKMNYLHIFCHPNAAHSRCCIHIWNFPECWRRCGDNRGQLIHTHRSLKTIIICRIKKDLDFHVVVYPSIQLIAWYRQKTVPVPLRTCCCTCNSLGIKEFSSVWGRRWWSNQTEVSHFKFQLWFIQSEIGPISNSMAAPDSLPTPI